MATALSTALMLSGLPDEEVHDVLSTNSSFFNVNESIRNIWQVSLSPTSRVQDKNTWEKYLKSIEEKNRKDNYYLDVADSLEKNFFTPPSPASTSNEKVSEKKCFGPISPPLKSKPSLSKVEAFQSFEIKLPNSPSASIVTKDNNNSEEKMFDPMFYTLPQLSISNDDDIVEQKPAEVTDSLEKENVSPSGLSTPSASNNNVSESTDTEKEICNSIELPQHPLSTKNDDRYRTGSTKTETETDISFSLALKSQEHAELSEDKLNFFCDIIDQVEMKYETFREQKQKKTEELYDHEHERGSDKDDKNDSQQEKPKRQDSRHNQSQGGNHNQSQGGNHNQSQGGNHNQFQDGRQYQDDRSNDDDRQPNDGWEKQTQCANLEQESIGMVIRYQNRNLLDLYSNIRPFAQCNYSRLGPEMQNENSSIFSRLNSDTLPDHIMISCLWDNCGYVEPIYCDMM